MKDTAVVMCCGSDIQRAIAVVDGTTVMSVRDNPRADVDSAHRSYSTCCVVLARCLAIVIGPIVMPMNTAAIAIGVLGRSNSRAEGHQQRSGP